MQKRAHSRVLLLFGIVCAQTFWVNFLPMRAGDLSYLFLLRHKTDVSATRGMASLLVATALDLWWMFALALGLGVYFQMRGEATLAVQALTATAYAGVVGGSILFAAARMLPPPWAERGMKGLEKAPFIGAKLAQLLSEFGRQTWSRPFTGGLIFSMLALALRFVFQLYLLNAMFADITPYQGLFALTFAGLVNLLPIQGIGNVGSIELPWAWALMSVGVSSQSAIASGFALHAIVLVYAVGVGILSLVLLRFGRANGLWTKA